MNPASRHSPGRWWRDAPALRFLSLFLLGWVGLRAAMPVAAILWSEDIQAASRQEGKARPEAVPRLVRAEPLVTVRENRGWGAADAGGGGASSESDPNK
jgi:hypothetical protein